MSAYRLYAHTQVLQVEFLSLGFDYHPESLQTDSPPERADLLSSVNILTMNMVIKPSVLFHPSADVPTARTQDTHVTTIRICNVIVASL